MDLRDRFETQDGSRPIASVLRDEEARALPLLAFGVLEGGDVFERTQGGSSVEALEVARRYVRERVTLAASPLRERVLTEVQAVLQGNAMLGRRMLAAKPLSIELVPRGVTLRSLGFPAASAPNIAGLFWDQPQWEHARIALREEFLEHERAVVFHEVAHAVHYLAFTKAERELIYRVLQPSFGSRAAMDEVFAIYSERELLGGEIDPREKQAPGIYGHTHRQWDESHLFTRFVRKLYRPSARAAGPGLASDGAGWMKRLAR